MIEYKMNTAQIIEYEAMIKYVNGNVPMFDINSSAHEIISALSDVRDSFEGGLRAWFEDTVIHPHLKLEFDIEDFDVTNHTIFIWPRDGREEYVKSVLEIIK